MMNNRFNREIINWIIVSVKIWCGSQLKVWPVNDAYKPAVVNFQNYYDTIHKNTINNITENYQVIQ